MKSLKNVLKLFTLINLFSFGFALTNPMKAEGLQPLDPGNTALERRAVNSEKMSPSDTQASKAWYFAEGNTMTAGGKNFTTFLLVMNNNSTAATVTVTYLYNGGGTFTKTHTAPANSKYSINTKSDVGLEKSFSVKITSNINVVAERALYWDAAGESWTDGSTVVGSTTPQTAWFFAEGNTMTAGGKNFTTFILIQNPSSTATTATVSYAFASGETVVKTHNIPANSKYSINAKNDIGLEKSFSLTLTTGSGTLVERSMYWNSNGKEWAGGDTMKGVNVNDLHFGYELPYNTVYQNQENAYNTYTLVYNPNTYDITVLLQYFYADAEPGQIERVIKPKTKLSINNSQFIQSKSFGMRVISKDNDEDLFVVEKSVYFDGMLPSEEWKGGYQQAGVPYKPISVIEFAEFNTQPAGGRNFYNILALINTDYELAKRNVTLKFYEPNGTVTQQVISVDKKRVKFINLATYMPNKIFSLKIETDYITAERMIYWNSNGSQTGGHGSTGYFY